MKTNLFKPQYTILQNVLYDKNDVDCFFVPTSLWQFLCSSHFLCPWNVYISFISFKCLIFFLGFNVDLISNDDSSGPCRHISGPNRPRDLQSINSREPWDSSRNRWILKVFPGSTIAMVGSWMKCQTFVISKCIYILDGSLTRLTKWFPLYKHGILFSTSVESWNAIIEYTLLCWVFFYLHCGLNFLFS